MTRHYIEHGADAEIVKSTGIGQGRKRSTGYRRGYRHEAEIAKRLNGERLGCTGKATADVDAGWLVVECKERKMLPQWLYDAVHSVNGKISGDQLAIVVLHQLGQRHDNDLVVLRLRDFEERFGETEEE